MNFAISLMVETAAHSIVPIPPVSTRRPAYIGRNLGLERDDAMRQRLRRLLK